MRPECPSCGFHFEREPGYFVGAMYFGYGVAMLSLAPTMLAALLFDLTLSQSMALAVTQLILTSPWIFRYARLLWIALDTSFSPPGPDEYRAPRS